MGSQSVRLGMRWVSTSHQRFSYDVQTPQLMEQREGESFSLSAFHREPNDAVVVRTGQSRVVPFEDTEVRSQVVVYGVFHRHVCNRERFLEPQREVVFCYMFDSVCCEWGQDARVREVVGNGNWRLAVAQSIAVTCARRGYVWIPEPVFVWVLRPAVNEQEEEGSGKKGEEREGSLAQEYHRHKSVVPMRFKFSGVSLEFSVQLLDADIRRLSMLALPDHRSLSSPLYSGPSGRWGSPRIFFRPISMHDGVTRRTVPFKLDFPYSTPRYAI